MEEALAELLWAADAGAGAAALSAMQTVRRIAADAMDAMESGGGSAAAASLLAAALSGDRGVVAFLERTSALAATAAASSPAARAREEALLLVGDALKALGRRAARFAEGLRACCVGAFRRDAANNAARAAALRAVDRLLRLRLPQAPERLGELFDALLREFAAGKAAQTVRAGCLRVAGSVAELYPDAVPADAAAALQGAALDALHRQFRSAKPDMQVLDGALAAVTSLLVHFAGPIVGDPKAMQALYKHMCLALEPPAHLSRYDIPKQGLRMLAVHAAHFGEYLAVDARPMFARLLALCTHINSKLRHAALTAFDAFVSQLGTRLVGNSATLDRDKATFAFLVSSLFELLESPASSTAHVTAAIRGLGRLAAPMQAFLPENEVRKLLDTLYRFAERLLPGGAQAGDDALQHAAKFVGSYACIAARLPEIDGSRIDQLERLVAALFQSYPDLHTSQRHAHHLSLAQVLCAVYGKGNALQNLLSRFTIQGLLTSCSRSQSMALLRVGAEPLESVALNNEYIMLWQNLLEPNIEQAAKDTLPTMTAEQAAELKTLVYDVFVQGVIQLIQRLDLSYSISHDGQQQQQQSQLQTETEPGPADLATAPVDMLQPKVPKDMEIFLSLVDLVRNILGSTRTEAFMRWPFLFGREMIALSSRLPLISGFYKLLSMTLSLCDKHGYFRVKGPGEDAVMEDVVAAAIGGSSSRADDEEEQKSLCKALFSKFLREVAVGMQQFQDELLCSCLELLLSAPHELLDAHELLGPMKQALAIGISFSPIAVVALDALERWIRTDPAAYKELVEGVLPSFNDYLLVPAADSAVSLAMGAGTHKSRAAATKIKLPDEVVQGSPAKIQRRIVRLLGKLGGLNESILSRDSPEMAQRHHEPMIRANTEDEIKITLPLNEPVLFHFDTLLPRILLLAENASERQIKVAACELLHSIVLLMIGNAAHEQNKSSMVKYDPQTIPCLLRLAVDPEIVTRQLFEPLVMQIIHLFTAHASSEDESKDLDALLQALVDGVCARGQNGLRELCARCLGEFVSWSIKHTPSKEVDPRLLASRNTGALLLKLRGLARHTDGYKRLGAAFALQSVIRNMRDERSLTSLYILEIAHDVLFSIRLAHGDDPSFGAGAQMAITMKSVLRVIMHYIANDTDQVLLKEDKGRAVHHTVEEFLLWVHNNAASPETLFRKQCTAVLARVVPLLPGFSSLNDWFRMHPPHEVFENKDALLLLSSFDPLTTGGGKASLPGPGSAMLGKWYETLTASLDCYTWASLFGVTPIPIGGSLYRALLHFVEVLGSTAPQPPQGLSPSEADAHGAKRTALVRALFDYGAAFLEKGTPADAFLPVSVRLFELLVMCFLAPSRLFLGFATADARKELSVSASAFARDLLVVVRKDKSHLDTFKGCVRKTLSQEGLNLCGVDLSLVVQAANSEAVQELATGYLELHELGILAWGLDGAIHPAQLARNLLASVFSNVPTFTTPHRVTVATSLLKLALRIGVDPGTFFQLLIDETLVNPGDKESRGRAFYSKFHSSIEEHVAQNAATFAPLLYANVSKAGGTAWQLLLSILRVRTASRRGARAKQLVSTLLSGIDVLKPWSAEEAPADQRERLLDYLRLLLLADKATVVSQGGALMLDIISNCLARSVPLSFKARAIGLLPLLGADAVALLRPKIHDIVTNEFPLSSRDLQPGSRASNEYLSALDEMLAVLEATGSIDMLEELYPVLREHNHVHSRAIWDALRRMAETLPGEQLERILRRSLDQCNDRTLPDDLRTSLHFRVVLPLLDKMPHAEFVTTICDIVKPLVQGVSAPIEEKLPTPLEKKSLLFERSVAFSVLRALYDRLSPDTVRTVVNAAFAGADSKGNELTQAVMRAAHAAKSEQLFVDGENVTSQGLLRYHCAAYSALVSAVTCTQSKEAFFTTLFFKENPDRGELVWDNIVDRDAQLHFDVETNFPLATRAVRSLQASATDDVNGTTAAPGTRKAKGGIRYLSMAYLQDSSLSEDLTYLGSFFTGAPPPQPSKAQDSQKLMLPPQQQQQQQQQQGLEGKASTVVMELDELNRNPSMPSLLRLLEHVAEKFPAGDGGASRMARWEQEMLSKMKSLETHTNVRLFIAKSVVNRPALFAPHAAEWVCPLLDVAMLPAVSTTPGINYFCRDICVVVLQWLKEAEDKSSPLEFRSHDEARTISQFVNFLLRNAVHPKREILRSNVEIIRMFIERWKMLCVPDKKPIFDLLTTTGKVEKANKVARLTGLQLLGALVANGLPAYDAVHDIGVTTDFLFFQGLAGNLVYPAKEVHEAAAEVCGLALAQWRNALDAAADEDIPSPPQECKLEALVRERITSLFERDLGDALACLFKVGRNHPLFVMNFYLRVFDVLPKVVGEFRAMALEMLLWCAPDIPDITRRLHTSGIDDVLRFRDDESQALVLQIYREALPVMKEEEIDRLVTLAGAVFPTHPAEKCREAFFDLLAQALEDGKNSISEALANKLRIHLLRAFGDKSSAICEKAVAFWDSAGRLPETVVERFSAVLQHTFTPEIEDSWLGIAAVMLLRLSNRRPVELDKPVFDKPLDKCQFQDLPIDPSILTRRSAPMSTPLFSQQAALSASLLSQSAGDAGGFVRATQGPVFTPTLASEVIMDVDSMMDGDGASLSQQQGRYRSNLLFNFEPFRAPAAQRAAGALQAADAQHLSQQSTAAESISKVRRRFQPLPATQEIIATQLRKKRAREAYFARQASNRAAAVVMMRRYRVGELPDIQIKPRDVIAPLTALVQKDQQTSRLLFVQLFRAILLQPSSTGDSGSLALSGGVLVPFQKQLEQLLSATQTTDPAFIGALHDAYRALVVAQSPVEFRPALVGASARRSGSIHSGILLIEEALNSFNKLSGKHAEAAQEACWSQLAVLYRSIEEEDTVLAIYQQRFGKRTQTKKALEFELHGDYLSALQEYEEASKLLDDQQAVAAAGRPSAQEIDLWESSRLECLSKLLHWKNLGDNVLMEVAGEGSFVAGARGGGGDKEEEDVLPPVERLQSLFSERYRDSYLGHFIKSSLKLDSRRAYLREFVDAAKPDDRELLETRFGPELAYLAATRGDLELARHLVHKSMDGFVRQWARLHPLAVQARRGALQPLQRLVEEEEFLDLVLPTIKPERLSKLLGTWHSRLPGSSDTSVWDDIATSRACFIESISAKLVLAQQQDPRAQARTKSELVSEVADIYHFTADAFRRLHNLPISELYLKLALKFKPGKMDFEFRFFRSLMELYISKALVSENEPDQAEKLAKALKFAISKESEPGVQADVTNRRKFYVLVAGLYQRLAGLAETLPGQRTVEIAATSGISELKRLSPTKVVEFLTTRASASYEQAVGECRDEVPQGKIAKALGKALFRYADFCDSAYSKNKEKNAEHFAPKVVSLLMEAIRLGSSRAVEMVPRIVRLLADVPAAREAFQAAYARVPLWVFVPWVSQLVSALDASEGPTLAPILRGLAARYPQALFFPLRVSRESMGPQAKQLAAGIYAVPEMQLPELEKFVEHCELLQHPEHRLKDWHAALKALLAIEGGNEKVREEIRRVVSCMVLDCFSPERTELGEFNRARAAEWLGKLSEADRTRLVEMCDVDTAMLATLGKLVPTSITEKPHRLSAYSRWMASYHSRAGAGSLEQEIELPGQYSGGMGVEPRPEMHAKIVAFEDRLLVMQSMRVPKRLGVLADDQRVHRFLVKGGEDLRLDERIQQAFGIVNGFLARDLVCSSRRLRMATYHVVPLSGRTGLVQWVGDTKPFKLLMEREWADRESLSEPRPLSKSPAGLVRSRWHQDLTAAAVAAGKVRTPNERFMLLYDLVSREEAVLELEEERRCVPADLLRGAILSRAASPEAFLFLRSEFSKSLSVFNIVSYLLGIGDRHLDNFLLHEPSGTVVGIDFGHAFGSATQILPIPELMPFRMTRQFVCAIQPHGADGLYRSQMAHALEAIRQNRDLLLNALDVFVKEPLMSWDASIGRLLGPKKGAKLGLASDKEARRWYPQQRLKVVRKKLKLGNPAYITAQELRESVHSQHPFIEKILKVALGDPDHNLRAKKPSTCESVLDQVDCLLDQATDPNILAKTYSGWLPWA